MVNYSPGMAATEGWPVLAAILPVGDVDPSRKNLTLRSRAKRGVSKSGPHDEHRPGAYVYILRCADDSYYVGSARLGLERRLSEHNNGTYGGYTSKRLPVELIWSEHFPDITDAIAVEHQIKGWSRAKKEALMRGDFGLVRQLSKRRD